MSILSWLGAKGVKGMPVPCTGTLAFVCDAEGHPFIRTPDGKWRAFCGYAVFNMPPEEVPDFSGMWEVDPGAAATLEQFLAGLQSGEIR